MIVQCENGKCGRKFHAQSPDDIVEVHIIKDNTWTGELDWVFMCPRCQKQFVIEDDEDSDNWKKQR